jgi:hypothetical protein
MNHKTFKLGAMIVYKASDDTLAADTAIIVSEHDAHFLGDIPETISSQWIISIK